MLGGQIPNRTMGGNISLSVPERIKKYTNREVLLSYQAEALVTSKSIESYPYSVKLDTGTSAPYSRRTTKKSKKLLPQNRVNIETLMQNADNTLTGKFLLCRCITPPFKMASIMTIVDDPEGKLAARLALYNYTLATSDQHAKQVLPVGLILAIKNPWFKSTVDGGYAVRCDNPADVIIVNQDKLVAVFADLKWKGDIPQVYQTICKTPSSSSSSSTADLNTDSTDKEFLVQKNLGNKCFVSDDFVGAIQYYTQALSILPKSVDALANRGAAYLNMRCYRKAKADLNLLLEIDRCHVKGIYRQVKCLWGMNAYKDALDFITSKLNKNPQLSQVKELAETKVIAGILLKQHQTGDFDMVKYLGEKDQNTPDGAEYRGPIKLGNIPGKGRGLIATEVIKPGQLIITSKPFAMHLIPSEVPPSFVLGVSAGGIKTPGTDAMIRLIAHKLTLEPESGEEFYKLFAGPELGTLEENTDDVDLRRIEHIEKFNAFSTDNIHSFQDLASSILNRTGDTKQRRLGIWTLPSFINHGCSESNCSWDIFGDMMFIRAVKPIKKNEEILISYCEPSSAFESRKSVFQSHCFECNCGLCVFEKNESEAVQAQRKDILKQLKDMNEKYLDLGDADVGLAMKLIARLESFRPKNPRLNLVLADNIMQEIAMNLFILHDYKNCLKLTSKTHAVAKDSVLAMTAVSNCCNMIGCFIMQGDQNMVNQWVKTLRHDLIVAYGSVQVFPILCPATFESLEAFGWYSFL